MLIPFCPVRLVIFSDSLWLTRFCISILFSFRGYNFLRRSLFFDFLHMGYSHKDS